MHSTGKTLRRIPIRDSAGLNKAVVLTRDQAAVRNRRILPKLLSYLALRYGNRL